MRRATSTASSNRVQLLQKKDDNVVITFAKRTAMGRAKRGQLKDVLVLVVLLSNARWTYRRSTESALMFAR
ncbi:hypothetical protein EDB86DRAFT_2910574 [Lactarius hatsudake]|nr:hypothetical protein EDB86DRAFT_2910574 [Lactarius hatsudake]